MIVNHLTRLGAILSAALFVALVSACSPDHPDHGQKMPEAIEITPNQPGKALLARYPHQIKSLNRPPNVNFYSVDWPRNALGTVQIKTGEHVITIHDVLGISGSDDPNFASEEIVEWHLYGGLGSEEEIAHDVARQRFLSLLQAIRNAGWQRYQGRGHPRLKGSAALRYALNSRVYALDPDYPLSLQEWMSMPDDSLWRFHLENAYLTLTLTRDARRKDVSKKGAYFIKLSLVDAKEEARRIVGPERRADWQAALPEELKLLKQDREHTEQLLKQQGVAIDESYQDPKLR